MRAARGPQWQEVHLDHPDIVPLGVLQPVRVQPTHLVLQVAPPHALFLQYLERHFSPVT